MPEEHQKTQEQLPCPICQRPLKRTADRLLSALECERCGPFTDFSGGSAPGTGGAPGPGDGNDPKG